MQSFYRPVDIGSLHLGGNLFLAPVAGYSDRAFRRVCRSCGADFAYTEMVSAEALVRGSDKTALIMKRAPGETAYAVQIFGANEDTVAEAARIVYKTVKPELVDINAGCPVPKIIKSGAGSFLTKHPDKLYSIVRAAVQAVPVPVTVKIRSGWDANNITWPEALDAALEAGAAALTIHSRTRAQGYEGRADKSVIAAAVSRAEGKIPVFASGDIFGPEDARDVFRQTGCAAVMFARGAMGNPFVFRQTREFLQTGTYTEIPFAERVEAAFAELELLCTDKGEELACREMRKRFCAYIKGVEGGASLRKAVVSAQTVHDYREIFGTLIVKTE
ncbi:tRNA dihydrouridine synthase DusB [Treponema sp. OMZ 840]|uniref:tRNA dihydrouridine synthase DusB n=1 Tax=Treponema sp. OMZ 840 TaxID=244313 RepID=UPI003D8E7908